MSSPPSDVVESGERRRDLLAALPSMTALLAAAEGDTRFTSFDRETVKDALAAAVGDARRRLLDDGADATPADMAILLEGAWRSLCRERRSRVGRVINATGIVLHTGLGRAPLAPGAQEAIRRAAGYCNLEFDLESGERGRRATYAELLLRRLTGAQAAMIVNNNAAATLLVLAALAKGRDVVVSRGQLVEIGGSYRLPDVMACSGCRMVEVGATNKTRLDDYAQAITADTAMLLRVHASNYRVLGFTEAPTTAELVGLARRNPAGQPLLVYDDLGSGALFDDDLWRAAGEPTVVASLAAGADVVSFSGDKLLGGPQAGIILGKSAILDRLRKSPMSRALRVDKFTIAALEATLELYLDLGRAVEQVLVLRLLHQPDAVLHARAAALHAALCNACPAAAFEIAADTAYAGGGSLPAWPLPTWVVRWRAAGLTESGAAQALRTGDPPVVPRLGEDAVIFDVRTIHDAEIAILASRMADVLTPAGASRHS